MTEERITCCVYRCRKQPEMYLYLRADLDPDGEDVLPIALRQRTGHLERAMELELHPGRALARVDVRSVLAALTDTGWYLQMPPAEKFQGHRYFGD